MLKTRLPNSELELLERGIEKVLAPESTMVTMLYGACRALGKVATDLSPEQFHDAAAQSAYIDGTWRHKEIGEYLSTLGVNFLSFNANSPEHDIFSMSDVGRTNNPSSYEYVDSILEGVSGDSLPRLSRKLLLTLGGFILWGMEDDTGDHGSAEHHDTQRYLGYLGHKPGIGSQMWDPESSSDIDDVKFRPGEMIGIDVPGTYMVDEQWLSENTNGNVIVVWTDETRDEIVNRYKGNRQLDHDVQIDAWNMLIRQNITPITPEQNALGANTVDLGNTSAIYTYGANVKSSDGLSALRSFGKSIGTDQFILPNTGGHSSNVVIIESSEQLRESDGGTCLFPLYEMQKNDGIIVIDPHAPICIPGADCPVYVGTGLLKNGTRITFGAHSGQIGMLRGLNENMVEALRKLDIQEGSVEVLVGPSAHTIELDLDYIKMYDTEVHSWRNSVLRSYTTDDGVERVLLNVTSSVVESLCGLKELLAHPPQVVMSNTLADPHVWSERGMAMRGQLPSKSNAVVVF